MRNPASIQNIPIKYRDWYNIIKKISKEGYYKKRIRILIVILEEK